MTPASLPGALAVPHDLHPHPNRLHDLILTDGSDNPSEPPFRERGPRPHAVAAGSNSPARGAEDTPAKTLDIASAASSPAPGSRWP